MEKELNEKDLLNEVKTDKKKEFHFVKDLNFLNFVMKTKMTGINKNEYFVEELRLFYSIISLQI